jgi:hypothetical protein
MPTFEVTERFRNDYRRLTERQLILFRAARHEFIRALRAWERGGFVGWPRFPSHLGIKPM